MDELEPYAEKMYLVTSTDYDTLLKEKHKSEQGQQGTEIHPHPNPQPHPHSQPDTQQQSYPHPQPSNHPQTEQQPHQLQTAEIGEGKRYSELDIQKFNRDFLTKQNIERFLENQKWNKIFERIKPFLDDNINKTNNNAPLVTYSDPDTLTPRQTFSKGEQLLRNNLNSSILVPNQTESARQAQLLKKRREEKETEERRDRRDRRGDRRDANIGDHVRRLFDETPDKNKGSPDKIKGKKRKIIGSKTIGLKNHSASPYGPADSTRRRKRDRNNISLELEDDESDEPTAGPSGEGRKVKRFKWAKF